MNDIMKIVQARKLERKESLKQLKKNQKNKKEDFQVCYQVLEELVCQEIYQQEKELKELIQEIKKDKEL